jgi:hypothetical protein
MAENRPTKLISVREIKAGCVVCGTEMATETDGGFPLEEMDRLISPSQFDKLNSFSTTLIRVLSQL